MPGNTTELNLKTALDSDDNADYLTLSLADSLRTVDALFNNTTGHTHSGARQGGAIGSIPATAIPDGSITSAKIADGTIVAADIADGTIGWAELAPHAVTSIFVSPGVAVSPATTSLTPVDMPEMIYTWGQPIVADLQITFTASVIVGAGTYAIFNLLVDSTTLLSGYVQSTGINVTLSLTSAIMAAAAGTHTAKVQWCVGAPGSVSASNIARVLVVGVHYR